MKFNTFTDWVHYYRPKFHKVFNMNMPFDYTGIDLTKLEGLLRVPEDDSMRNVVRTGWGEEAVSLLEEIIDNPPPFPK